MIVLCVLIRNSPSLFLQKKKKRFVNDTLSCRVAQSLQSTLPNFVMNRVMKRGIFGGTKAVQRFKINHQPFGDQHNPPKSITNEVIQQSNSRKLVFVALNTLTTLNVFLCFFCVDCHPKLDSRRNIKERATKDMVMDGRIFGVIVGSLQSITQ